MSVGQEKVVCTVLAISMTSGNSYHLNEIESFQTNKSDQSEPGSFQFSCPLSSPHSLKYLSDSSPMDIIAIYARRLTSDDLPASGIYSFTASGGLWGSTNATVTRSLQGQNLVFLGVVDSVNESYSISDSPRSTLNVSGTDFTKFLACNDSVIPFDVNSANTFQLSAFSLNVTPNLYQLMLLVCDALVAKNPDALKKVIGAAQPDADVTQIASALGFPWRNFISTAAQDAKPPYVPYGYSGDVLQNNYQIQSGPVWSALVGFKNEPLNRLFITEDGEFLVDDNLSAILEQDPILQTIEAGDFSDQASISRDDSNVATFITLMPAVNQAGVQQAAFGGIGATRLFFKGGGTPNTTPQETVASFGVRQAAYTAMFDSFLYTSGGIDEMARQRLFRLIQLTHNSLDVLNLTVKGQAYYRVGTRVFVNIGFPRTVCSRAVWYICSISQSYQFGSGWQTMLTLRYPQGGSE